MRYRVTIEGRERDVDVDITPSGSVSVSLDGKPFAGEVRPIPGGVSLRSGSEVRDVLVAGDGELQLASGRFRGRAEVVSERQAKQRGRGSTGAGAQKELRAPMPGRVVKVLVQKGDAVTAGQALVVIEAMKMENELRAAVAATIGDIHVSEGASVESRALLITFG